MADPEADACWHLLVTTEGGTVSILRNLDAPTARQAYKKLRPSSYPRSYINASKSQAGIAYLGSSFSSGPPPSAIKSVDILGPEGAKLDPWKGVEPRVIDLSDERQRQSAFR
jgi:hypothetical protein